MASNTVSIQVVGSAKDLQRAFKDAEASSKSFGARFKKDAELLGQFAKRGVQAIAALTAAVVGISLKGGIDRLMGLERANKQLDQLGVTTEDADGLMESLLTTLRGTPFALDKGAESLAGFVASGRELDDIPRLIQQVTDTAAFGNTTLEEVDFIWQRIQTTGRATNEELRMLAERNIPVYTQLAGAFGTTAEEVFNMASNGELSADIFFDAWEKAAQGTEENTVRIAGAAQSMGETTEGAWGNMRTAMSRFGATILEDVFPLAKDAFNAIGEGFDRMGEVFSRAFDNLDTSGIEGFIERIPSMMEDAAESVVEFWEATETFREIGMDTFRGISEILTNKVIVALGGVLLALKALYAHPVIAGLALVSFVIGKKIGDDAEVAATNVGFLVGELTELSQVKAGRAFEEWLTPHNRQLLQDLGVDIGEVARLLQEGKAGTEEWDRVLEPFIAHQDSLIQKFALGKRETMDLADALDGAATAQTEMREAVDDTETSLTGGEQAARDFFNAQEDVEEATEETTEALEEQVSAIDEVIAANQRATDPFLQALHAQRQLKTAQTEYNEALEEFGPDSEEAIEAAGDLIEANNNLDAALATIAQEGGPNWRAEFRRVASQAGIAEETIDEMIAAIEEADGLTATATINIDIARALEKLASLRRAGLSAIPSGLPGGLGLHSGGIVSEGLLDGNRSNRREAVLPLDTQEGKRALAQAVAEAMGGTGGGLTVNVYAGMGADGGQIGDDVVRVIEEYRRRNGRLPWSA